VAGSLVVWCGKTDPLPKGADASATEQQPRQRTASAGDFTSPERARVQGGAAQPSPCSTYDGHFRATATPSPVGSIVVRKPGCSSSRLVKAKTPRVAGVPSFSPANTRPDHNTLSVMNRPPARKWACARSTISG